ncbi:hypothetical protein OPV22_013603 [Ensete ventricosum]|uniref:GH18 domain-containing protein n=1 Tax=Ensete ventricosum TaxID=4639 RepID=A0AAV8R5T1_ENSVE|nr:hypothetical protein OPV22_013603 [Ensete ventricosum]
MNEAFASRHRQSTMASHNLSSLLVALLVFIFAASSHAGSIAVYWGQNGNEGGHADNCNTRIYSYVMLSFLTTFGNGQTLVLNLAGHYDPPSDTCTSLSSDIGACQSQGIKVLLSLGGSSGNYSMSSSDDDVSVAIYLWDNYLGGSSSSRSLGNVVLDDIDFDIEQGGPDHYDELVKQLSNLGNQTTKVYLSAAPQCPYPDQYVGNALQTGLFDYVWDATRSGYILPDDLTSQVLSAINDASNYDSIMLWSRYYDLNSRYGTTEKIGEHPGSLLLEGDKILIRVRVVVKE